MIEAYLSATLDVLRLAGQMFLRRMDDQLRWFAEDLHDFIYDLDRHPRRDWRERFDAFLADQAARHRVITPESRAHLIAYLEVWEQNVYGGPPESTPEVQAVITRVEEPEVVSPVASGGAEVTSMLAPRTFAGANRPAGWWPFGGETVDFYRKLNDARGCIYDIERMLPAIASRIANAKEGVPLEIDDELNAIESLIWRHNDLLESAREIWLRESLGQPEFAELDLGPTPVSLGLPLFTDEQQAARAKAQLQKIGARLKQKIAFLDNVIFAMQVIEAAGTIASFALGAGVIINAGMQGGKVVLVKTVAKMTASVAISAAIGKATGAALEAIGVEEETVEKVQNAVELISWLLILRRMKLLRSRPDISPSPAKSTTSTIATSSSPPRHPPKKSDRAIGTQGGDPDANAAKARSQPYGPPRKKTYPKIEGELDKPRTKYHEFLQETIAQEMRATGDYVRITRRMRLSKISGVKHSPDIEPDNIGVRQDGRIDVFEILSPSQTREQLEAKLELAFSQLPAYLRGAFRIIDPKDAFK